MVYRYEENLGVEGPLVPSPTTTSPTMPQAASKNCYFVIMLFEPT